MKFVGCPAGVLVVALVVGGCGGGSAEPPSSPKTVDERASAVKHWLQEEQRVRCRALDKLDELPGAESAGEHAERLRRREKRTRESLAELREMLAPPGREAQIRRYFETAEQIVAAWHQQRLALDRADAPAVLRWDYEINRLNNILDGRIAPLTLRDC